MKKKLSLLLAATLLVSTLAACGGKTTGGSDTPAASTPPETTEPITITYWHTYTDHHEAALKKVIDGFNASQDKYVVVAEQQPYSEYDAKLLQATANKTGPDIASMYATTAIVYKEDGYLYDMTDLFAEIQPNFKSNVPEGVYNEATQWDGKSIYLCPITITSEVLYYNKTMFDELNLTEPTTWEELEECAKAIYKKYGVAGFGTDSITDTFQGWIKQDGSDYIDTANAVMAIDKDIAVKRLNWFADGVKAGHFRLVGEDHYFSNPFGSKAVGMYIGSVAGVDYALSAVPAEGDGHFEVGCCPIPQGANKYISSWGGNLVCLSKDEEHARGVVEFLNYFTSDDVLTQWANNFGAMPARISAINTPAFQEYANTNIAISALGKEYSYIHALPAIYGSDTVRTEIDKMVQTVALGLSDAETAFDNFVAAANNALQDY